MEIFKNLKLDRWYKILLWISILMMAGSIIFKISFLHPNHLFGFGLGLLLLSFSCIIAETKNSIIKPPNYYTGPAAIISWPSLNHSKFTITLFLIGLLISILFLILLIISLI